MIEIGMHKIYKNFGYKQVLKDINFEILTGDRVGIEIGRASCRERV